MPSRVVKNEDNYHTKLYYLIYLIEVFNCVTKSYHEYNFLSNKSPAFESRESKLCSKIYYTNPSILKVNCQIEIALTTIK